MNLREFLDYRTVCPICNNNSLNVLFHSNKKQKIRRESNRFLAVFEMRGKNNKQKSYEVGYSIDEITNQFCIELYNDKIRIENLHLLDLLKRVREMNNNHGSFRVIKRCTNCNRYDYESNSFHFDYKNYSIGDLSIASEFFGLCKPKEKLYKIYRLYNDYINYKSTIVAGFGSSASYAEVSALFPTNSNYNELQTSIINFVSTEDTYERINKLILFS